jgi:hypothetical protein
LLLFRGGYGDWPERTGTSPSSPVVTLTNDRFLVAPKVEAQKQPLTAKRPLTKLR